MDINHKEPTHNNALNVILEDDTSIMLQPLVVIEYNKKEYIALTPQEEDCEDVYFYQFKEVKENQIELLNIDDNQILEVILDEFEKWFDEQLKLEGEIL